MIKEQNGHFLSDYRKIWKYESSHANHLPSQILDPYDLQRLYSSSFKSQKSLWGNEWGKR